eukprot:8899239-Heterocapsa_arctica.AAC.1
MEFSAHETLVNLLIKEYMEEPPMGYARVSLEQIQRADRLAFVMMGELTSGGIRAEAGKEFPLQMALRQ